jgi:hypothetical protein
MHIIVFKNILENCLLQASKLFCINNEIKYAKN